MEVAFLKSLTEKQAAELAGMAAELKALAAKLQSFRLTEGDNRGCAEDASDYATAASNSIAELVSRCQPSARRFGRR